MLILSTSPATASIVVERAGEKEVGVFEDEDTDAWLATVSAFTEKILYPFDKLLITMGVIASSPVLR
jgi:hypothetical protein